MHLYLNYTGTVIEILFPTTYTLQLTSEQIVNLEQKLKRRLDVTVAYTELEATDTKYRFKSIKDAIDHLEKLVSQSDNQKRSEIDKLAIALTQHNFTYRQADNLIEINDQFANLDYFFSIRIMNNGEAAYVYYNCGALGDLGSITYSSIDDVIADLVKLKELDSKFKSLVADAPFNLDRSKKTD